MYIACYSNSCPSKTNKTLVPFYQKKAEKLLVKIFFCKDKASLSNFQLASLTKLLIPPEMHSFL